MNRNRKFQRSFTRHFGAICEHLERRRMLSDVVYSGSFDDDAYTVRLKAGDPTQLEVVESLGGGSPTTYTAAVASVDSLTINAGSGYDRLTIDESNGAVVLPDGIFYSGGADFDELVWDAGPGADVVQIVGSELVDGSSGVQFSSVEDATVNGNGGADVIEIESVPSSLTWSINGNAGNDRLDFTGQDLDSIAGDVTFDGGANVDRIHFDDSTNSFSDDYTITASNVSRFGFSVGFSSTEELVLDCETGGNSVFLTGSSAMAATVNGGGGNDMMFINGNWPSAQFNGGLNAAESDSLIVNVGTYTFNADAVNTTAHLSLSVNGSSTAVMFNASQHLASLSVSNGTATASTNGSRVIVTDTLSFAGTGKFDLRDNDLIVRNDDLGTWNGSNYTGITGLVRSGRNGGSWTGTGIVTSLPLAVSQTTTLAAASASQVLGIGAGQTGTWQGETVAGGAVLVKYTYGGDANLTGKINADDYFALDSHYNKSGAVFGYYNGDFNYDGAISGDDYYLIDSNYGAGGGVVLGPSTSPAEVWFVAAKSPANSQSAVREDLIEELS